MFKTIFSQKNNSKEEKLKNKLRKLKRLNKKKDKQISEMKNIIKRKDKEINLYIKLSEDWKNECEEIKKQRDKWHSTCKEWKMLAKNLKDHKKLSEDFEKLSLKGINYESKVFIEKY